MREWVYMASIDKTQILEGNFRVCLDSRLVKSGEYFVAVKRERFDGHDFVDAALKNGAVGVIEEEELYDLTKFKLSHINPNIVGVTGSSGKSTTVRFITQILARKYTVCEGELNTKLGLSVNVINDITLDCEVFVAEMGMDDVGEIAATTELFPPDIAVITTINEAHLEKLDNLEAIGQAKFEIVEGLKPGGVSILNYDNELIRKLAGSIDTRSIWFGLTEEADVNPSNVDLSNLQVLGEHNILNALAAVTVAKQLQVSDSVISDALKILRLPKGRLNVIDGVNESTLIDDSYNASPISTLYALDTLATHPGERKIAIFGDMLELGSFTREGHQQVATRINELAIDVLVTVGDLGRIIYDHVNGLEVEKYSIPTANDFSEDWVKKLLIRSGDAILIKGSQGARMEKITKILMQEPERAKNLLIRQDARWG